MMRIILLVIAGVGTLWGLVAWLAGGFQIAAGPITISSTDPWRPLAAALVAAVAYAMVSGATQLRRDVGELHRYTALVAVILALSPALAGLARNSWTAAGADSYAYVSQADLWLRGTQRIAVPLADVAPWPRPVWTFTPYGFRPAASGSAIVPMTAPGLSLLMALAKRVAGHCAMFWVVPLTGALLVWMTFLIGRDLGGNATGLGASWLMATSPAFLAMLVSPMSDVPAAAFWAVAIYFTIRPRKHGALAAGLAAGAAIMIRANLAPLAGVLFMPRVLGHDTFSKRAIGAGSFVAGLLPGCLFIAWMNRSLYGSPLASGYGDLSYLFHLGNVPINVRRYGGWLVESQTPFALVGIAALFFYSWLLAFFVLGVFFLYVAYTPFEAWWFLRFLLPAWPAICVGTAAFLVRRFQILGRLNPIRFVLLVLLGVHGILFAASHGAFPTGEGDHRYATIAKLVEEATDPASVILTGQNAGPTRYYAGRETMTFDQLDEAWLDRSVTWLTDRGRRPYFLLEEWELPRFQTRFGGKNRLGTLPLTPILAYQARGVPGRAYLFDPARPDGPTLRPIPPASTRAKCVEPAAPVVLDLK